MAIVNNDTKLYDIIISEPSIVTVLNRFDIVLGVGDHTVESICKEKNIDANFVLTILNTYINESYFPERIIKSFKASKVIDYLKKTNDYYTQYQVPNIERHFNFLISRNNDDNSNLMVIYNFFIKVKHDLISRIDFDSNTWFPDIIKTEETLNNSVHEVTKIDGLEDESDTIEDKLGDLINMIVIHLSRGYDTNLCFAVLISLINLNKDIKQNNRIRNRVLRPVHNAIIEASTKSK